MRAIGRLFLLVVPVLFFSLLLPQISYSQTLYDLWFGNKKQETKSTPPVPKAALPQNNTKTVRIPIPKTPKAADAKRILVLGDFVGNALSDGLNQIYNDNANVMVINAVNGSSGLVRDDYYDWTKNISQVINKEKPDIIIMIIGANDNQSMTSGGKTYQVSQKEWRDLYQKRINMITAALKKSGKPWIWMGQAPFQKEDLSHNILEFNRLYKQATESANGRYVEVWDGFIDDNGDFAFSGFDVNGQTTKLRTSDGINYTNAGRRKLAFYAEKPLEAIFNNQSTIQEELVAADPKGPPVVELPREVDRLAPISYLNMARKNNGLLGQDPITTSSINKEKWQPKNVKHRGRVDDFSL